MNKGEPALPKSYVHRYLNYAISLIQNYHGTAPFHLYLKKYFSTNKKHGSKDRKIIASLCYDYFRLGMGVNQEITLTEKLLLAAFLVEQKPSKILAELKHEWNENIPENFETKAASVKNIFNPTAIFPFNNELSGEINVEQFNFSFLTQPKVYVRIRPGKEKIVLEKLENENIFFERVSPSCLAFSNNEKISNLFSIDKDVVIQDYNSQQTGDILMNELKEDKNKISLWDCCAASGGKSILAYDRFKNIELTVSDTRKNILRNLESRFQRAGVVNYTSFVADVSAPAYLKEIKNPFDVIIADVPCSGSGTWARTPEQLTFFDKKEINRYAKLQQKIVLNVIQYLKENAYLLYITCSVFKKENEDNVDFLVENSPLQLVKSEYLKGYGMQADTLFAALFKK